MFSNGTAICDATGVYRASALPIRFAAPAWAAAPAAKTAANALSNDCREARRDRVRPSESEEREGSKADTGTSKPKSTGERRKPALPDCQLVFDVLDEPLGAGVFELSLSAKVPVKHCFTEIFSIPPWVRTFPACDTVPRGCTLKGGTDVLVRVPNHRDARV
jgi:hypothetical protein